jgi:hypothetical protein
MTRKIESILNSKEINTINQRIASRVDVFTILITYKSYSKENREMIKCYIKERSDLVFNNTSVMGHKNEPYHKSEDEMIIPKYTWDDLSNEEKKFYNENNK